MWIITGPFDGDVPNEVGFQKSKVLKSGKSYLIGRKPPCDLVVNHKKVSHDHGQFVVGGFSPDDVTNTVYTPTLRILNSKNKTMRILREGVPDGVIVNPGVTEELQPGDQVDIVSSLPLTVQWQRICCFETPGKVRDPIPLDGCASLGVHVVRTLHPDITHHLVPSCALTPAHMTSLLSAAQLVKPEWLSELLALSILDPRESARALERNFAPPPVSKFRPAYAATLPSILKTFKAWEPNETRINMLKGYRFVFVGDKGLEIPAGYRELVKRGGAEYEAFTVSAGVVRWRKALLRAKALAEEKSGKVVLVADGGAMELAVGAEGWDELVSAAKSFELELIQPENILQAVAHVDTFYLDSAHPADSQGQSSRETLLPHVVPNTLSGESSIAPPVQPPALEAGSSSRTTSEQARPAAESLSKPTSPEQENAEVPLPRRLPPRRATERNRVAPSPGPGDDAVIAEPPSLGPPLCPILSDVTSAATQLPTPISQTRRLPPRRRANLGIDASTALASSHPQPPPSQFSQLDKYKALFDASNPDRPSSETQSVTTQSLRTGTLSAVPEEEESQSQHPDPSGNNRRGTKRSRPAGDDDDVEMADVIADASMDVDTAEGTHRVKRRAVDANAVQLPTPTPASSATAPNPSTTSTQTLRAGAGATGAGVGAKHGAVTKQPPSKPSTNNKLDTDENFLKAVNSTKRSKKLEDDFDREFNLLRIAKPNNTDLAAAAASAPNTATTLTTATPWDAIDDFDDVGIRGNFMVVVEMDIECGSSAKPAPPARTSNDARPEWIGRPNFKKFKTKPTPAIERRPIVELVISEENDYGIGNAYWREAASRSQSYSESHDVTAAHPPLSRSKSKSKPPSKTSRARAPAIRGKENESLDVDVDADEDERDSDDASMPKLLPTGRKTRAKAKAPAAAKPASKTKTTTKTAAATTRAKAKEGGKAKAKAPASTKAPSRKKTALFLSDESDEMEEVGVVDDGIEEWDKSAAAVAREFGVDDGDGEEVDVGAGAGAIGVEEDGDEREDAGMTSTLRSTAGTQIRREAARATKRRAAALAEPDDDSDDAVFKGFGRRTRKKGRVG